MQKGGALFPLPACPGSYLLFFNKEFACLLPVHSRSSFFNHHEHEPKFQYYLSGIKTNMFSSSDSLSVRASYSGTILKSEAHLKR